MKVAFTGHRDYSTEQNNKLEAAIRRLYAEGYTTYMSGMAQGFDLAAAEVVLRLKSELTEVQLHCIIPFKGHILTLNHADRQRYSAICDKADCVVTLASERTDAAYFNRNDYLVDGADAIICYYSGKRRSGTGYTVTKAMKKGCRVINIYADGVQIQFFGI